MWWERPTMFPRENKSNISKKKNATFKISVNCISHIDLKCRLKYFQAIFKAWIELASEKSYNTVNKLINTQKKPKVY